MTRNTSDQIMFLNKRDKADNWEPPLHQSNKVELTVRKLIANSWCVQPGQNTSVHLTMPSACPSGTRI